MKLHEKLFELRKERNITQQELAETLDVSRQAISRWEMGLSFPSVDNLLQLSRLYNVSIDYLINEDYSSERDIPVAKATEAYFKFNNRKLIKRFFILFFIICLSIIFGALTDSVYTCLIFISIFLFIYVVVHITRIVFIYFKRKGKEEK